jgi:hypothetical protein
MTVSLVNVRRLKFLNISTCCGEKTNTCLIIMNIFSLGYWFRRLLNSDIQRIFFVLLRGT